MYQHPQIGAGLTRHLVCLDLIEQDPPPEQRQIDPCRRLLAFARSAGWPITHIHPRMSGRRAARPAPGLGPLPSEPVLYRGGASAFSNRSFDRTVKEQDGFELVILSFSLSSACLGTALCAYDLGLPVLLIEDALSNTSADIVGLEAIETVARSIVAPFVQVSAVDELIDPRRGLRLVAS